MQTQEQVWFPWKEAYSVQIPEIDAQHKRLVEIINRLQDAMLQGQGRTVIDSVLRDLEEYTRYHFTAEEDLMRRHAYPKLLAHEAQHQGLVEKVSRLRADFRAGSITMSVTVMEFLRDWLTHHIMQEDKAYTPHLLATIKR